MSDAPTLGAVLVDLAHTVDRIAAVIDATCERWEADRARFNVPQLDVEHAVDANGQPLLAPLLVAKANALAVLATGLRSYDDPTSTGRRRREP